MSGVFYYSAIHGLGFFLCFMILRFCAENNKTLSFYGLYSDKQRVFDQSGHVLSIIIIIPDQVF